MHDMSPIDENQIFLLTVTIFRMSWFSNFSTCKYNWAHFVKYKKGLRILWPRKSLISGIELLDVSNHLKMSNGVKLISWAANQRDWRPMSRRRTTVLSDLTVNIKGQVTIVNFIVVGFKFFWMKIKQFFYSRLFQSNLKKLAKCVTHLKFRFSTLSNVKKGVLKSLWMSTIINFS